MTFSAGSLTSDTPSVAATRVPWVRVAALCGALALFLCVPGLTRAPWLDEAATLRTVSAATWRAWAIAVRQEPVPPAFHVLLAMWSAVSHHIGWLRLLPLACGVATVAVGAAWGARVSRRAVWSVGLLLATSPFLLRYALELRGYALLALASVVAWRAAWDVASETDEVRLRRARHVLTAATGVACATHFTAVLLIPAVLALVFLAAPTVRLAWSRVPISALVGIATMWAGLVAAFSGAVGLVRGDWWMPALGVEVAGRTLAEVAGLTTVGHGPNAWSVVVGVGMAGVLAAVATWAPRSRAWVAPCGAALVYAGGLAVVSWVWQPVWWPRTLLPAWVACVTSLGLAVASVVHPVGRRVVAASVALVVVGWCGTWAASRPNKGIEPWQEVAAFLAADPAPRGVLAFPDFVAWPLRHGQLSAAPESVAGLRSDERGTAEAMASLAARAGRTYLVLRIDPGVVANRDGLVRTLDALRATIGPDGPLTALLVMSPDVSLMPALSTWQRGVTGLLVPRFGDAVATTPSEHLTVVRFDRGAR